MNEKLQYAEMLEIPVSTCNVTYKPPRKRKVKPRKKINTDEVKAELIEKVNAEADNQTGAVSLTPTVTDEPDEVVPVDDVEPLEANDSVTVSIRPAEKKKFRRGFSIIAVQLTVIGALVATIFLTNALVEGSGINSIFKGTSNSEIAETLDERNYAEFSPVISASAPNIALENGIITVNQTGSLYAPCDGIVTSVTTAEDGSYSVEIAHSENFKSVIDGLTYVYVGEGGEVYKNLPVGYASDNGYALCFYNGESAITNFTINENAVVWAV